MLRRLRVLRMPQLSPTMLSGRVKKFCFSVGDLVQPYDLFMVVTTNTLLKDQGLEEAYDNVDMDIEIVDGDLFVCQYLCDINKDFPVGYPIAILSEDKIDVQHANKYISMNDIDNTSPFPLAWQAYKSSA
eukprot:gene17544-24345_t